ncbi:hypothetical protein NEHOM01_0871 [Nematocida homosporus]|uniref:uncharacterized protein n=1 Tax=Nematocida homosporus TaxID=1912981 RepID=UPI00221EA9DA|nr:uncharacterized protein NEHOM01_0871 [Nematocida homosporus]KAI5185512.1 hypothetical protein NEHOM01_0871 [Nematocida homosporus]
MFNAEAHFLSRSSTQPNSENKDMTVWLGTTAYEHPPKKKNRSEKADYENITWAVAQQLNQHFTNYIAQMVKQTTNMSLLALLSKTELMGALASPVPHAAPQEDPERTGIIVNETKNTLAISINGVVKIFPKAMYNFFLYVENKKYFFIGPAMKIDRKYTK